MAVWDDSWLNHGIRDSGFRRNDVYAKVSAFARTRKGVREQREGARGHGMGEAGLVVGSDRFFTSLRYVQNDMWGSAALGMTCGGVLRLE